MSFIERLNQLMDVQGITGYKMAKDIGISERAIVFWRKGEKKPGSDNLLKVANYLGVTTEYLLGNTDDPNPQTPEYLDSMAAIKALKAKNPTAQEARAALELVLQAKFGHAPTPQELMFVENTLDNINRLLSENKSKKDLEDVNFGMVARDGSGKIIEIADPTEKAKYEKLYKDAFGGELDEPK